MKEKILEELQFSVGLVLGREEVVPRFRMRRQPRWRADHGGIVAQLFRCACTRCGEECGEGFESASGS